METLKAFILESTRFFLSSFYLPPVLEVIATPLTSKDALRRLK
jgi:hypothetical protein